MVVSDTDISANTKPTSEQSPQTATPICILSHQVSPQYGTIFPKKIFQKQL